MTNLLRDSCRQNGPRVALQFNAETYTYSELDEQTNRYANALAALGVAKGNTVSVMIPNSSLFIFAWMGLSRIGAILVPINTDYVGDILRHQLSKAAVSHIIIDAAFLPRLAAVLSGLPSLQHVIVSGDGAIPQEIRDRTTVSVSADLAAGDATDPAVPLVPTDPCAISFTSGTTGASKGVLASNAHLVNFALQFMTCSNYRPGDSLYSPLPLFHALASWLGVIPTFLGGGRMAIVERFSATNFWDDVRRFNTSHVHGIFSMIPMLLKQPPRPDDRDQPARVWYLGQQSEVFEQRFNCRIVEIFGLSECGIVTMTPFDAPRKPGSCGIANTAEYDVKLVDDNDLPVPVGQVGEFVIRPKKPFIMFDEYFNAPRETLACYRNLWFHTGDNGRRDEDGYFYFVDRKKDVIRRRGENISSHELESVMLQHPAIEDCAAIAAASEVGEDDVKLVVVVRPGAELTAADIWAFCDGRMPRFWVPRYIEFRRELPKTPTQKVQKYLLRQAPPQGPVFDRLTPAVLSSETPAPSGSKR